jgi:hypothetical protein
MESVWVHLLIAVLSVAGLFGAVLVAGLIWAYAPLCPPPDSRCDRRR